MKPVRLWIGLVLLTIGVFGLLDASGVIDASATIGRWWPVAIIGLGLVAMASQRAVSVGPVVVTTLGLILLVNEQGWAEGSIVGPAVLALVGVAILVGLGRRTLTAHPSPTAVFGGTKVKDTSEHLRHQDVSAIFGGATLDLREAHIDREATVDAFALFGGVEILVPKGWRVALDGLPIFGGYDDKTTANGSLTAESPVLKVNATAVFGGVEVANEPH